MSQSSGGAGRPTTEWLLDPQRRLSYYYDAPFDQIWYENGVRVPRPDRLPRDRLLRQPEDSLPRILRDEAIGMRCYHNAHSNELVYEDGRRERCDHSLLRMPSRFTYQSPPTSEAAYELSSGGMPPQSRARSASTTSNLTGQLPNTDFRGSTRLNGHLARSNEENMFHLQGLRVVDVRNEDSQVRTRYATQPLHRITDPLLYANGVRAQALLLGTNNEAETLFKEFKLRPRAFFRIGRVFHVLWAEPAGGAQSNFSVWQQPAAQGQLPGRYPGERIYSKVRRFVVIRVADQYCSALPIASYGKQGVAKKTVTKSEHCIIYTGTSAPHPMNAELPRRGELAMRSIAIRVIPDDIKEKLDPMSRLDFGKVHSVQYNLKVKPLGMVHSDSIQPLLTQFESVWRDTISVPGASSSSTGRSLASNDSGHRGRRQATVLPQLPDESGPGSDGSATSDDDDESDDSDDQGTIISDSQQFSGEGAAPYGLHQQSRSRKCGGRSISFQTRGCQANDSPNTGPSHARGTHSAYDGSRRQSHPDIPISQAGQASSGAQAYYPSHGTTMTTQAQGGVPFAQHNLPTANYGRIASNAGMPSSQSGSGGNSGLEALHRLMAQGCTREEAFNQMVQAVLRQRPDWTRQDAVVEVRRRLGLPTPGAAGLPR